MVVAIACSYWIRSTLFLSSITLTWTNTKSLIGPDCFTTATKCILEETTTWRRIFLDGFYPTTDRQWTQDFAIVLIDDQPTATRRHRTQSSVMIEDVLFSSKCFVTFVLNETRYTIARGAEESLRWICPSSERHAILREEYWNSHKDNRECNQHWDRSETDESSIGKWRIV